jgi:3-oxoacyl-[acyl-carrier-protein] synthase II
MNPDKSVLVTGSSRGIGRAVALRVARAGYALIVHGRAPGAALEETAAAVRALDVPVRSLCFDVADRAAAAAALEADVEAHGAYYGVVCNAGITRDAPFPGMTGEDWDLVMRTDLDSFYNVLRPVVMPMIQRRAPGRIVTIASVSGILGNRGQANYAAAKAGVIAATKSLALERGSGSHRHRNGEGGSAGTSARYDTAAARRKARGRGRPGRLPPLRRGGIHHPPGVRRRRRAFGMRRVVITGMAGISPLGNDWATVSANLKGLRSAVVRMDDWTQYRGLNTLLAAPAKPYELPSDIYPRKVLRSMGPVARMAVRVSELALREAGLYGDPVLRGGRAGVAFGSSTGSPEAIGDFANMLINKTTEAISATTYIRMMPHTTSVNIAVHFGLQGRVYTTSTACTSGSQSIGLAYEAIKDGRQDLMIAGGAEELTPTEAAVFDTLFATSVKNNDPTHSPRPFDKDRDGLVVGEGAGAVILEEREHALARGARILAEVIGFGTNCDGTHVTQPSAATMAQSMRLALADAGLSPDAIGYVNAHGTATEHGDIAETTATRAVFGRPVAISSLKSYMGHTLGACGALECWMTLGMQKEGWVAPTLNLANVDPRCADLDYVQGEARPLRTEIVMSNNFAFGGINTSLIFRAV